MMSDWEIKKCDSKEMIVNVAGKDVKVMMQRGFFNDKEKSAHIHRHNYTEIHFSKRGKSEYIVGNERVEIKTGEVLVIPGKVYHQFEANEHNFSPCAFQINIAVKEIKKIQISPTILDSLLFEIEEFKKSGRCARLASYIGVILSHIADDSDFKATDILDREFLVHEFFDNNYCFDKTLSDLAAELNLSEKQTQRVIRQILGNTFRQELRVRRMNAAVQLLSSGKHTPGEVARLVGYRSYSGFWKAYCAGKD